MDKIDLDSNDEFASILAGKDPRPFVSVPCPGCGRIGGFMQNDDGSLDPACCIPCLMDHPCMPTRDHAGYVVLSGHLGNLELTSDAAVELRARVRKDAA